MISACSSISLNLLMNPAMTRVRPTHTLQPSVHTGQQRCLACVASFIISKSSNPRTQDIRSVWFFCCDNAKAKLCPLLPLPVFLRRPHQSCPRGCDLRSLQTRECKQCVQYEIMLQTSSLSRPQWVQPIIWERVPFQWCGLDNHSYP